MAGQRRSKPRYKVNVAMRAWDIAKAGAAITMKVRGRGGHIGTLEIGQGSIRWKASYSQCAGSHTSKIFQSFGKFDPSSLVSEQRSGTTATGAGEGGSGPLTPETGVRDS